MSPPDLGPSPGHPSANKGCLRLGLRPGCAARAARMAHMGEAALVCSCAGWCAQVLKSFRSRSPARNPSVDPLDLNCRARSVPWLAIAAQIVWDALVAAFTASGSCPPSCCPSSLLLLSRFVHPVASVVVVAPVALVIKAVGDSTARALLGHAMSHAPRLAAQSVLGLALNRPQTRGL